MSGLHDLLKYQDPALGACVESLTEGADFCKLYTGLNDDNGDPIDLTSATGVCKIIDANTRAVVLEPTFTGYADGSFELHATDTATTGLAGPGPRRECLWSLTITIDPDTLQVWGPETSTFIIYTKD